ncbi:hypothetical protein [Streptomyces sp. NBC_01363]|nr:hypothetical protein [Streptomyces sp. NBC_01363]MCX4735181.1 hypothetical protein [Streptomyces sp. NBC_01363]
MTIGELENDIHNGRDRGGDSLYEWHGRRGELTASQDRSRAMTC